MSERCDARSTVEPVWLGVASPPPQPRLKQNAMFGHVADAFDEKSIFKIGQTPTTRQSRTQAADDEAGDQTTTTNTRTTTTTAGTTTTEGQTAGEGSVERQNNITETTTTTTITQLFGTSSQTDAATARAVGLLIRGGRVVNDDASFDADVSIVDGKITAIGVNLPAADDVRVIDARGKLVLPAGVDSSVHLVQSPPPSSHTSSSSSSSVIGRPADDVYHGTRAALSAGNTTVVDTVVAEDNETLLEAYERCRAVYESMSCCDYSLRVAVTSWSDQVRQDMQQLVNDKGVNLFVLRLSDDSDLSLYHLLRHCSQLGALAVIAADCHPAFTALKAAELVADGITGPEGHLLSHPQDMEAVNVCRAITVAGQANAALCVANIASKMSADVVTRSRRRGKVVFADVMLAALAFSGNGYYDNSWSRAAAMVTSPPLRPAPDTAGTLLNNLANGEIQCVASDHRAFNLAQKAVGKDDFRLIPAGVNGVAERLAVVWDRAVVSGKMDVCRYVAVTSTNAAKMLNVYPRKGRVAVGSDADLVVWDTASQHSITSESTRTRADVNVYDGMSFRGAVTHVIHAGQVAVDSDNEGRLCVGERRGQLLLTPARSDFIFARLSARDKVTGPEPVERDASSMPAGADTASSANDNAAGTRTVYNDSGMYSRPPTSSGGRNMQDSSFSLSGMSDSGAMDDALKPSKKGCGTKISQPPGGHTSTQLW